MRGEKMGIIKAIQRLGWRFSEATKKDNTFTVNQNDIDALTTIAGYVEQTQKQQYEANHLFAKLYTYMAMKIMDNDGSTVFENNHRRKIGNLLKKPLSQIMDDLTESLNDSERYGLLESIGVDLKHPALRKEAETTKTMKELNKALKTPENDSRLLGNVFSKEHVQEAMIAEINLLINLNRY